MYLGIVLIIAAVVCVVLGIVSGGAFTIVLVPLAVIAAVAAVVAIVGARAAGVEQTLFQQPEIPAKGRVARDAATPGEVPATPDEYVEARQKRQ